MALTIIIDDFEGNEPKKSISIGVCRNAEESLLGHSAILIDDECTRCWEQRVPGLGEDYSDDSTTRDTAPTR